jgi:transposase
MCGSGARWCARADAIFDVPDMHVLDVEIDDQQRLVLTVESGQAESVCPACGVMAVGHGRRLRVLHDAPCFARVTLLRWLVRIWRCREPLCPTTTFSETHDVAPPRMVLTTRAVAWATSALSYDDTTVSALARHLGVDWHTAWDAIEVEAKARTSNPDRLSGVKTLGVDEHIWRPSRVGVDRAVTIMVDLSRDPAGCLHARLLDAVVGRSGSVYKARLKNQPEEFIDGIDHAALDPFRGYANAIHDGLPDAVAVLDAFHVVRLGTQVVDEVRRRVQQDTLGRRGHKHDPLYKIRGLLRHGVEHLTERQQAKISRCLDAGDPTGGVPPSFRTADRLRSIRKGEEFMSGKYPKYSPEFREEAAKMVVEGSRAIAQVAREYGLSETTVGNWVRAYREAHATDEPPLELSERARLRELERQNRELEMENAFLKKAAAYFAREPR